MSTILEINSRCISCDLCKEICPQNAIISSYQSYFIESSSCTLCQYCIELCPVDSIKEKEIKCSQ